MIKGVEHLPYEEKLRQLYLFSLEEAEVWLINDYKYIKGECHEDEVRLFLVITKGKKMGKGYKLEHKRFHLNLRRNFSVRVTDTGTGCPGRLWSLLLWRRSKPTWTHS